MRRRCCCGGSQQTNCACYVDNDPARPFGCPTGSDCLDNAWCVASTGSALCSPVSVSISVNIVPMRCVNLSCQCSPIRQGLCTVDCQSNALNNVIYQMPDISDTLSFSFSKLPVPFNPGLCVVDHANDSDTATTSGGSGPWTWSLDATCSLGAGACSSTVSLRLIWNYTLHGKYCALTQSQGCVNGYGGGGCTLHWTKHFSSRADRDLRGSYSAQPWTNSLQTGGPTGMVCSPTYPSCSACAGIRYYGDGCQDCRLNYPQNCGIGQSADACGQSIASAWGSWITSPVTVT